MSSISLTAIESLGDVLHRSVAELENARREMREHAAKARLDALRNMQHVTRGADLDCVDLGFESVDAVRSGLRGSSDAVVVMATSFDPGAVRTRGAIDADAIDAFRKIDLGCGPVMINVSEKPRDEQILFMARLVAPRCSPADPALFFDEWLRKVSVVVGTGLGGKPLVLTIVARDDVRAGPGKRECLIPAARIVYDLLNRDAVRGEPKMYM